jgi:hypothetical protein
VRCDEHNMQRAGCGTLLLMIARAHVLATELYVGGLLGVSARVVLCRSTERAKITLSGIPIGYSPVSGTATFGKGPRADKNVLISEPLATVLRRRFVKISDVHHDKENDLIIVTTKLPLILGTQQIVLQRAKDQDRSLGEDMLAATCND